MNNKKALVTIVIAALVILSIAIIVTLMTELTGFAITLIALFIVLAGCLSIYIKEAPDEYSIFLKEKKRILKTYNSVIVEVETLPNIAGKNIIKVKTFDDLIDAQLELREPIYYKNDNDSCFFLLLHYNEACIYILKLNNDVISPTELSIRYMKPDGTDNKTEYETLLEAIEDTVVFKLDELRSYKISPIRNGEVIEVVDDTAIKKSLENTISLKQEEVADELSKTKYIKDLKARLEEYENDGQGKTKKQVVEKTSLESSKKVEHSTKSSESEVINKPLKEIPKKEEIDKILEGIPKKTKIEKEKAEDDKIANVTQDTDFIQTKVPSTESTNDKEIKKKKTTKKVSHASRRTAKYAKNLKDKEEN